MTAIGGIYPELRARRLQESARLVRDEFAGSLRPVLALDPLVARRSLKKFPTIGDPGADKILLFTGTVPSLAPESNGLRVLVRFGFVEQHKNYATMYRAAQSALQNESGGCASMINFLSATVRNYAGARRRAARRARCETYASL